MKKFRTILAVVLATVLVLCTFAGCSINTGSGDIVVLFTGNVANQAQSGVTYAGVSAYKAEVSENHNFVALLDCGNSLGGSSIDLVANGEYATSIMNEVGYDYYVLGSKDFSVNPAALAEVIDASYISSTAEYIGDGEADVAPYIIEKFAKTAVAFVGVTAPDATSEDFDISEEDAMSDAVQSAIDDAKKEGANYVVLVSALDEKAATDLVADVEGVDVVLNSSENAVAQKLIKDGSGNNVVFSDCGKELAGIGQLIISSSGTISTTNVVTTASDEDTALIVSSLSEKYEGMLNEVIGTTERAVGIHDNSGIRKVQNRETGIDDLVADAYKQATGADIALVSADEIEIGIDAGDITLAKVMAVTPQKNSIGVAELTGQQIADILEYGVQNVSAYYASLGQANGEFPGFLQVSGIKFTVRTSYSSAVVKDEEGNFESLSDTRRVTNIMVPDENGEYVAIDPEKTYAVAGAMNLLSGKTNGNTLFSEETIKKSNVTTDYTAVLDFIKTTLSGDLSAYYENSGRITMY